MKNKKRIICISLILLIILLIVIAVCLRCFKRKNWYNNQIKNENISTVISLEDNIEDNSVWCGTFNLIWNDLKNEIVKKDIVFNPQIKQIDNLNKGTFTEKELSEESYYKIYGFETEELKNKIKKDIRNKFNEDSKILDDFSFDNPNNYFLYSMLKKEFKYKKEFSEIENIKFKNKDNVEFFGINDDTEEEVKEQVEVLYYDSKNKFAIKIKTTGKDEIIIVKGNNKNTFKDIYEDIKNKTNNYDESIEIEENEIVAVPNIKFNVKKELKEIENKKFYDYLNNPYEISKALQYIEFEIDKKGGKIKSEAGMEIMNMAAEPSEKLPRSFIVDDTFSIFLKETNKELPYFAAKISDIDLVQDVK